MTVNDKFLRIIKTAAAAVYANKKPCNVFVGRINTAKPLTLDIGIIKELPSKFIEISSTAAPKIKDNSSVIVIMAEGGQKFFITDVIADMGEEYDS